jgi:hypothetical protein
LSVVNGEWSVNPALRTAFPAPHAFFGDIQLTQITDTVYYGNGAKAQGKLLISWPAFTTAAQNTIAAGSMSVTLGANGYFNASLAPTVGSTPPGVYYTVVYQLDDGSNKQEYWAVPATQQTTISAVRAKLMPSNTAAQFLTRDLADSVYVHANDNQTIGGLKTFSFSPAVPDPQKPTDVANKEYVDANAGPANLDSPPPIGSTTPNSATFTDLVTKNTPAIDVRAYGAHCAQGYDDSVALQSAINAAQYVVGQQSIARVVFPAGKQCFFGTTLQVLQSGLNSIDVGGGGGSFSWNSGSQLVYTGSGDAFVIAGSSGSNGLGVRIHDLRLDCNASILVNNTCQNLLSIPNNTMGPIYLDHLFLNGNHASTSGTGSYGAVNGIYCPNHCEIQVKITDNLITNFSGALIALNGAGTNIEVRDNQMFNAPIGVYLSSSAPVSIHDNYMELITYGVQIDNSGYWTYGQYDIYDNQFNLEGIPPLNNITYTGEQRCLRVLNTAGPVLVMGAWIDFHGNQCNESRGYVNGSGGIAPYGVEFNLTADHGFSVNFDSHDNYYDGMTTSAIYSNSVYVYASSRNDQATSDFQPFETGATNIPPLSGSYTVPTIPVVNAGTATIGTVTAQAISTASLAVTGDLSARDIPGHAYFVSKYPSIQAAINAAYGSGTVSGNVIDDRTAAYSGPGFYIPDSVTVRLAPVPYSFTSAVTHNNGNNNVTAAIIVEQGAHLAGGGTSSNHGTTITVGSGFGNDIIATTSVGTGTGAGVQWWHWGSIENLNVDGTNQTMGECVHVENMGETSKLRDLLVKNCYSNNVEFVGAAATQSDIANISTSRSRHGSGVRFTNLSGLGKITGLSGDCNAGSLVSAQENAAGTLVIVGLKSEAESTICSNGASHDPVVLLDTLAGLNTHVHIAGGYAFGTAQNAIAKVVGSGGGIFEMEGFYATGYTNLLNDTIRSVVIPATSANSKQPFYYEPNGIVFANQAFTLIPGTGVMGGSTSLTPIFYATTGNATMVAPIGNGDGQSIITGGVELAGQNRTQYGATPEVMARAGYRFTGSGYDTTKWDLVPAWNTSDTTEKNIGNSLTVCQKNGSVSCRWSHIYGVNVDALVFTLGTYTVSTLPGSYGVGSLAWVSDAATPGACNIGGGSNRVLCYYTGSAWAALTTGGGGAVWGSITGTLSNQTDLQSALNGKAASNASTTVNGVTCALGSSCAPGEHLVSGTMVGPQSGIVGNGADQNVFSATVPAGTVAVGTGFRCNGRFTKTTTSNSITFKWTLGSTLLATQSVTSASSNWMGDIEVFTPISLSSEVANVSALLAGTTIQAGPQVGLTASENLANASTIKLTFNASSSETITPKMFYCTTVQ